jgi:type VII secretion protein EccE
LHIGQFIAAEIAGVATLGAWLATPDWLPAVAPVTAVVLLIALLRVRGKWAYEWVALATSYATRQRVLRSGLSPAALVTLARPDAALATVQLDGGPVGVVSEAGGPSAIIEIGTANTPALAGGLAVPPIAMLAPVPEPGQPAVRLRLITTVSNVTRDSPAAHAYRQLTDGNVPSYRRMVLAVQVRREPGLGEAALRHALGHVLRRTRRRLRRSGLSAEILAPAAALATIAELAHVDPAAEVSAKPLTESWPGLVSGDWHQATFRLAPAAVADRSPEGLSLPARLLNLPGCAVTLALVHDDGVVSGYVRLAAESPGGLAAGVTALRRQLMVAGTSAERLDGAQLTGLAETLPLGGPARPPGQTRPRWPQDSPADPDGPGPTPSHNSLARLRRDTTRYPPTASRHSSRRRQSRPGPHPPTGPADLVVGGAGVMLGTNRHGEPVVACLFRREPTRLVLLGGPACAQLVVLRALAVGAAVYVSSDNPAVWHDFLRAAGGPGWPALVIPLGQRFDAPSATSRRPQLIVTETIVADTAGSQPPPAVPPGPWRTTLHVRQRLGPTDVALFSNADLAVLAPTDEDQATIVGEALGLGAAAQWLSRIRGDMIGAVVPRHAMRWAMATPTQVERQLLRC